MMFFLERFTGGYLFRLGFMRKLFLPIYRKLKYFNTRKAVRRVRENVPCHLDMVIYVSAIKQIRKQQIKDKLCGVGNG